MQIADYERQIEELQKKQSALKAREKQLKAKMSKEKRAKETHAKIVLGGAIFGIFKAYVPTDRKELDLYGLALKRVIQANQDKLSEFINTEFMSLLEEQKQKAQAQPSATTED